MPPLSWTFNSYYCSATEHSTILNSEINQGQGCKEQEWWVDYQRWSDDPAISRTMVVLAFNFKAVKDKRSIHQYIN